MSSPSDAPVAEADAAPGHYDVAELRRCMVVSFSAGELGELARAHGMLPSAGSLGGAPAPADETARALLRHVERQGGLDSLVQRLREERPLVQWPEAVAAAPARPPEADEGAAQPPLDGLAQEPAAPGPLDPAVATEPEAEPASSPPAPAAGPPPPAAEQATAAPGLAPQAVPTTAPSRAGLGAWAHTQRRWLLAAGGGALLVAMVVAFVAGRASSGPDADQDALPAADPASPAPVAKVAAEQLSAAVTAVAEACGVADARGPAKQVLANAFRACSGPDARRLGPPRAARPALTAGPSTDGARPTTAPAQPPRDRPAPAPRRSGCLDRCEQQHQRCKQSECGAEPASGSAYSEHQRCLSRCLTKASKCRLRCG